jgi:hypothetical protein
VIRGSSVGTMTSFGNKRPRNRASILQMGKTSSTTCVSYDEATDSEVEPLTHFHPALKRNSDIYAFFPPHS